MSSGWALQLMFTWVLWLDRQAPELEAIMDEMRRVAFPPYLPPELVATDTRVMRCTCCGRWSIQAVEYTMASRGRNGRWLRLTRAGAVIGEYRTPAELAQGLDHWHDAPALAEFAEDPAPL